MRCTGSSRYPSRLSCECLGFIRQRFRYCLMRLRWLAVRATALFPEGAPSGAPAFPRPADMARPSPTSCALLAEGESVWEGEAPVGLSVVHILMRCTELSKLLQNGLALTAALKTW